MAYNSIQRENIPLKAYLRADSQSQHFCFEDTSEELVSEEAFWGDSGGLYLHYSDTVNHSIRISQGISNRNSQQKFDNECDNWIVSQLLNPNSSKLYVVEGYAGCGKTTFVNYLVRSKHRWEILDNIDIGASWSPAMEPFLFFDCIKEVLHKQLEELYKKENDVVEKVWDAFKTLGEDNFIPIFHLKAREVVAHFMEIIRNSPKEKVANNLCFYLMEDYENPDTTNRSQWQSIGQTDLLVSVIILLKCAESLIEGNDLTLKKAYALIFDNTDIITNPAISAENVFMLWQVIDHYNRFKEKYCNSQSKNKLPELVIFITVRKVLHSHITSHLVSLEMNHANNPSCATVCDMSDLYSSKDIVAHRIDYWLDRVADEKVIKKFNHIKKILSIQSCEYSDIYSEDSEYMPKSQIDLDAFVNHNYRAFSNALSAMLDEPCLSNLLMQDYDTGASSWQKVSTLIFSISSLYKGIGVWGTMGFGCRDISSIDYPTTLTRLILNYVNFAQRGQSLQQYTTMRSDRITNSHISLREILNSLARINFFSTRSSLSIDDMKDIYETSTNETVDLICDRLATMCARTFSANFEESGYDSEEDELWRRPIYFISGVVLKHTAATFEELKGCFKKSIEEHSDDTILFSITDEGYILINDIVASFEFYSARFCDRKFKKPLHQCSSVDELDQLITPVYELIEKCCERNLFLKDKYLDMYSISLEGYLKQPFHPRTKEHFKNTNASGRLLVPSSFRPQLHIVRVIYAHIGYFNSIKAYLANSGGKRKMCECLTEWIEDYLKLYYKNFFPLFKNINLNADNVVYEKLWKLKDEQKREYATGGTGKNIDIRI